MSNAIKFRWSTLNGFRACQRRHITGHQDHSPEQYARAASDRATELFGEETRNWPAWALAASLPSQWAHAYGYEE